MIVADTNVLAYLCLPGEHTRAAAALLEKDPEWIAPTLWRSEFRNVLMGYMRRGQITLESALAFLGEMEKLLRGYDIDSRDVLELARDSGCTAYDCEFVALARSLEVRLVTMDQQILKAFPKIAVSLTGH